MEMELMDDNSNVLHTLYYVCQIITTTLFLILLILQIIVLCKLKIKYLDKSTIAIMVSFTLLIGTKMINLTIYNYN